MKFVTHDNGGRSFVVTVDNKKFTIQNKESKQVYFRRVFTKMFIGLDSYNAMQDGTQSPGNSMLFKIKGNNRYIFVGCDVRMFTTPSLVKSFHSPIANNDIPMPYVFLEDESVITLAFCVDLFTKESLARLRKIKPFDDPNYLIYWSEIKRNVVDRYKKEVENEVMVGRLW